jgi:hypothetical protein
MTEHILKIYLWDGTDYEIYVSRELTDKEVEDIESIVKKYKYSNYNNENDEMYNEIERRLEELIIDPECKYHVFYQDF